MKFSLPTRPFMDCAFQVSKKVIAIAKVIQVFSMLSSQSLIFLHFTFRSVIPFELILVRVKDLCLDSFFCTWMSSCSSTICSIILPLLLSQRSVDCVYVGLFSALCSAPLIHLPVLLPVPLCLECCSFRVSFEFGQCQSSHFALLLYYHIGHSFPLSL